MLTSDDERCCICGQAREVKFCQVCGHRFCSDCRTNYFRRGYEAVMELLGRSQLYCGGGRHG